MKHGFYVMMALSGVLLICAFFLSRHAPVIVPRPQKGALSVITPDWTVAATLTALGKPPVATGDVKTYPDWSLDPTLPPTTIDLGARFNPNPELTRQLQADLVIVSPFYGHLTSLYADTPVWQYQGITSQEKQRTWQDYANATHQLAATVGQSAKAKQYVADSQQSLQRLGQDFRQKHPNIKRLAVVQFASVHQIRSYANNSPFYPALQMMGLQLHSFGEGNAWGSLDISLADLSTLDEQTCLVIIEPFSVMLQTQLQQNALWQQLQFGTSKRCLMVLPPIWAFGEIPTMVGFATALSQASAGVIL